MARAKPKTTTQKTHVAFLLDRTGSMQSIKGDTIGAFNAYIETLKKEAAGLIDFTFVQFDSQSIDKVCVSEPIASVKPLTDETYQPRAATPLIDAAFKTITATEAAVSKRDDKPKVVVAIQTDGEENSSTEHNWNDLNSLIKRKTGDGWQFVFMGAGIDAYAQGAKMGVSATHTVSYGRHASRPAMAAMALNTAQWSTGNRQDMSYTMAQRAYAGDVFWPGSGGAVPASAGTPQPSVGVKSSKTAAPIVDDLDLTQ